MKKVRSLHLRTDSLNSSEEAHQAIKEKVEKEFGKKFYLKNKKSEVKVS